MVPRLVRTLNGIRARTSRDSIVDCGSGRLSDVVAGGDQDRRIRAMGSLVAVGWFTFRLMVVVQAGPPKSLNSGSSRPSA
jgi:hypothetical protein